MPGRSDTDMMWDVLLRATARELFVLWEGSAKPEQDVIGRKDHVVVITNVGGGDTFSIQGKVGSGSWENVSGATGLTTNVSTRFSGLWDYLQAVRTAGTGTATKLELRSRY